MLIDIKTTQIGSIKNETIMTIYLHQLICIDYSKTLFK